MKRPEVREKVSMATRGVPKPQSAQRGGRNGRWVGGRVVDKYGYVRLRIDGRYVAEHRYVMEQHLGRQLTSDEIAHHRNGIKGDNRLENLQLMSQGEHCRLHSLLGGLGPLCGCGCGMRIPQHPEHPGLYYALAHPPRLAESDEVQ